MEEQTLDTAVSSEKGSSSLSWRGIGEVFYKPSSFFHELKDHPKILVPYIVLFVLSFIMMYLISDLVLKMQLESPELQEQLQGSELPPQAKVFMKYSALIGGTIGFGLIPLITAAFALFFGNFVMAGSAKFKQLFSIMIYSEILFVIGGLIATPMALAKGSLLAGDLSLGVLVADQGMTSLVWLALSKVSVFHIWEIIVAGIGLATIYSFPRNKGYVLSVLSVGLLSVIHISMTAISKMF